LVVISMSIFVILVVLSYGKISKVTTIIVLRNTLFGHFYGIEVRPVNSKWTPYMLLVLRDTKLTSTEVSAKLRKSGIDVTADAVKQKRHRLKVKCDHKGGRPGKP
jgi:hypothetical protein